MADRHGQKVIHSARRFGRSLCAGWFCRLFGKFVLWPWISVIVSEAMARTYSFSGSGKISIAISCPRPSCQLAFQKVLASQAMAVRIAEQLICLEPLCVKCCDGHDAAWRSMNCSTSTQSGLQSSLRLPVWYPYLGRSRAFVPAIQATCTCSYIMSSTSMSRISTTKQKISAIRMVNRSEALLARMGLCDLV